MPRREHTLDSLSFVSLFCGAHCVSMPSASAAAEYIDGTDKLNNEEKRAASARCLRHMSLSAGQSENQRAFRLWWCVCEHLFVLSMFSWIPRSLSLFVCASVCGKDTIQKTMQNCRVAHRWPVTFTLTHRHTCSTFTLAAISWSFDFWCILVAFAAYGLGFGLDTICQNAALFA